MKISRELSWQTAKDNERAQRLYERIDAKRAEWVDYSVDVSSDFAKRFPVSSKPTRR